MRIVGAALLILAASAETISAQGRPATFKGLVLTDSTEIPIPGATVVIEALKLSAISDSLGQFILRGVSAGVHTVVARKLGFTPIATRVVFANGAELEADLLLSPNSAQTLTEVIVETKRPVTGKMAEFEERRLAGHGKFLTQEDLDKRAASVLSNTLKQLPGVEMTRIGSQYFVSAGRMSQPGGALMRTTNVPCPVAIVLDGTFLYGAGDDREPKFPIDQINQSMLAGIEYYTGPATIPVKYNATRHTCGLLVLWTK
jgi:hypothetical protein